MSEWLRIDEHTPEENQPVYYYFGVFDCVYAGFYQKYYDEDYPEGVFSDCFYSKSGFLTDDVTYWMPREELPEGVYFTPVHPTEYQKETCKYHPKTPFIKFENGERIENNNA